MNSIIALNTNGAWLLFHTVNEIFTILIYLYSIHQKSFVKNNP